MRNRFILTILAVLLGLSSSFVLIIALAQAKPSSSAISEAGTFTGELQRSASPDLLPLRFPTGNWPWYAQEEITLYPEPAMPGSPAEICAQVVNDDVVAPHLAMLQFGIAPLGIGVPYNSIGTTEILVPPAGYATGCVMWVVPEPGLWGIEVLLFQEGAQEPLRSQRNVDVNEPLQPGVPNELIFHVGNPFEQTATLTLGIVPHLSGWGFELSQDVLQDMQPGEIREVTLTVTPPVGQPLPADHTPIVDVEAFVGGNLIGGFRKIFRPPVSLHSIPDPIYAEREITVDPYPILAGEPTEICVELRNPTPIPQNVVVRFSWANFGIGLPFTPINGPFSVQLPPYSVVRKCLHWVPPVSGHVCLQVTLEADGYAMQSSQRNVDVNEPLQPGVPDELIFHVGNPFEQTATLTLGIVPHLSGWGFELSQDVLQDMQPGEIREVTLTVTPPIGQPLPADHTPVVDVEAYVGGNLIGGFRKIFRPPVPIHIPKDPIYAESEIFVHPYPPRAGEPTEIGVEIRNPTDISQPVTVTFSVANFGIGLPFQPIAVKPNVIVPPHGIVPIQMVWVPPFGGLFCVQVGLSLAGYEGAFFSQRNIDVGEPLEPLTPHARVFLVGNPMEQAITITLGLVPHLPGWGFELSQDVLPKLQPGETKLVTLTVTPPADLPPDDTPIVDVEAYADGTLIGGFRKIYRPPVPIHRPKDPIYAESEIGVDPYPVIPGEPTRLSVEVFNPTDEDHVITATFSIAPFGIGLPFDPGHITPNPVQIYVPAHGAARGFVVWSPPDWQGKFCVKVTLELQGHAPIWSQRNIDVGEPLQPGVPNDLTFPVGSGEYTEPVTVTLGLILHKEGWQVSLSKEVLENIQPGGILDVTLSVTPPPFAELGSGEPIVDVEAYVEGELLGGFRKLDVPPIPIHKPHEKGYSESEIFITPYPPRQGEKTLVGAVVQNTSDVEVTVDLEFGWAEFGMGIPFTTSGMVPYKRTITLGPAMTATPSVEWTPLLSGPQCIIVHLTDPEGIYAPQLSQRNVDVIDRPPCGTTQVYTFTVANNTPYPAIVDIGVITFNVPPDWVVTTVPSGSVELEPYEEMVIEVHVTIPCPTSIQAMQDLRKVNALQTNAGGMPLIDVEGYIEGELIGGIELQFGPEPVHDIFLPLTMK